MSCPQNSGTKRKVVKTLYALGASLPGFLRTALETFLQIFLALEVLKMTLGLSFFLRCFTQNECEERQINSKGKPVG
jgi:hypothetical protein